MLCGEVSGLLRSVPLGDAHSASEVQARKVPDFPADWAVPVPRNSRQKAVKKPAPAPPKPGNPPPGQPGGQSGPGTAQQTPSLSLKPATGNPSPPVPHAGPAPGQPCATVPLGGPRRASGSLAPMQAPSHPPPQPPTQAPQSQGLEQPTHTPPRTPTPPSTPPLAKQSPGLLATQHPAAGHPETAQPHAGTLPRPRPVPKPRNRPSVPPPPHPPGAHPAADGSLSSAVPTASKIVTDANSRGSEPLRGVFPDLHSDADSKDLPGRLLLDMDNDTESTAL